MSKRSKKLTRFARDNRKNPTRAEAILWWTIRNRALGVKFRRQEPIGSYIADFACWSHRLVVEIDGPTHFEPGRQAYDRRRDAWFQAHGWTVIRTDDDEVWSNRDGVVEMILEHIAADHPPGPASS
jgi:very-short-patch-repair endonuclease